MRHQSADHRAISRSSRFDGRRPTSSARQRKLGFADRPARKQSLEVVPESILECGAASVRLACRIKRFTEGRERLVHDRLGPPSRESTPALRLGKEMVDAHGMMRELIADREGEAVVHPPIAYAGRVVIDMQDRNRVAQRCDATAVAVMDDGHVLRVRIVVTDHDGVDEIPEPGLCVGSIPKDPKSSAIRRAVGRPRS